MLDQTGFYATSGGQPHDTGMREGRGERGEGRGERGEGRGERGEGRGERGEGREVKERFSDTNKYVGVLGGVKVVEVVEDAKV